MVLALKSTEDLQVPQDDVESLARVRKPHQLYQVQVLDDLDDDLVFEFESLADTEDILHHQIDQAQCLMTIALLHTLLTNRGPTFALFDQLRVG